MFTSGVPISTKILLYFFQPISSLSFEVHSYKTYGCETQGSTYVHTHGPMDFWLFWPLGTTISGFQLLTASIPSTQKLQNEITFFSSLRYELSKSQDSDRPSQYFTLVYSIEYKCESQNRYQVYIKIPTMYFLLVDKYDGG